jgi:hypothetical protein
MRKVNRTFFVSSLLFYYHLSPWTKWCKRVALTFNFFKGKVGVQNLDIGFPLCCWTTLRGTKVEPKIQVLWNLGFLKLGSKLVCMDTV